MNFTSKQTYQSTLHETIASELLIVRSKIALTDKDHYHDDLSVSRFICIAALYSKTLKAKAYIAAQLEPDNVSDLETFLSKNKCIPSNPHIIYSKIIPEVQQYRIRYVDYLISILPNYSEDRLRQMIEDYEGY